MGAGGNTSTTRRAESITIADDEMKRKKMSKKNQLISMAITNAAAIKETTGERSSLLASRQSLCRKRAALAPASQALETLLPLVGSSLMLRSPEIVVG